MTLLILGLVLFLGVHSISIVAPDWRNSMAARLGEWRWKGIYSVAAIAGFALAARRRKREDLHARDSAPAMSASEAFLAPLTSTYRNPWNVKRGV